MNHPSPQADAPDLLVSRIRAVLEEHPHKPPRVLSKLIAEVVRHPLAPAPTMIPQHDRPEPAAWEQFRDRPDPIAQLVDAGVATTRNRTHAAMRALGLSPTEVRALVIEHDSIRVYRWDPPLSKTAGHRPSIPQTMPVLEEPA